MSPRRISEKNDQDWFEEIHNFVLNIIETQTDFKNETFKTALRAILSTVEQEKGKSSDQKLNEKISALITFLKKILRNEDPSQTVFDYLRSHFIHSIHLKTNNTFYIF